MPDQPDNHDPLCPSETYGDRCDCDDPVFMVMPNSVITEDELRTAYAKWAMLLCGGNKSKAARLIGVDRRSLYRRLECDNAKEPTDAASD